MSAWRWYFNRVKSYIGRPRLIVQERVIERDDQDRCESPIFIVGVHRSGTSLVRRMFNSHPQIACPPETFFIANYVAMLDDAEVALGYEGFGQNAEDMRADLSRKAASQHEAFRRAQGKIIWADKTPQYTSFLDGIDRLFDRKARFVLVLRHPCDIVHSIHKRGWRFNDIKDPFESTMIYVRQAIDNMLAFEEAQPGRCARLDYHKLCAAPGPTLEVAMAKIGIAYDPEMLAFGDKNHNYGLEDPVVRGKKSVEISTGAWHSWTEAQKARAVELFGERAIDETYWA